MSAESIPIGFVQLIAAGAASLVTIFALAISFWPRAGASNRGIRDEKERCR